MKAFTLRRVVISLLLALAGGLLVVAVNMTEEPQRLVPTDEAVRYVAPEPNTVLTLRQTEVVVQLAVGYQLDALRINNTAVGGTDVVHVSATNRYSYAPAEGKPIERFPPGRNCVTAEFHRGGETVADGRTYTWCFQLH